MTVQKIMRKIILPSLLLLFVVNLSAQRNTQIIDKIIAAQEDLQLTEAQVEDLESLKADTRQKMQDLRALEKAERKTQVKAHLAEVKSNLQEILTPEQLALIEDKREEKKAMAADRKANMKAAKQEIKAYHKEHVKPVMNAQRQKLEADITPDDRLAIDDLRTQFKASKKDRKENAKASKGNGEGRRKAKGKRRSAPATSSIGHFLRSNEEAQKVAEGLVDRYQDRVNELNEEIAGEQAKWEADKMAIKEKYRSADQEEQTKRRAKKREMDEERNERKAFIKTLSFILMKPETETQGAISPNNRHQLNAYPNPASGTQTLELVVAEAGNVNIELVDKSGKVVKSVFNGNMEPGTHSLQVDISGLPEDAFFYKVTDASGVSSKQAVISKD